MANYDDNYDDEDDAAYGYDDFESKDDDEFDESEFEDLAGLEVEGDEEVKEEEES